MAVNWIPEGYRIITPYLLVKGAASLIDFMKKCFDAVQVDRLDAEDGSVRHAQVRIGDSIVMMGEACGQWEPIVGSLYIYVKDTDATYRRCLDAGAVSVMEPADQFYGDRNAGVKDPSGTTWWIATHIEDVTREEISRRAAAYGRK